MAELHKVSKVTKIGNVNLSELLKDLAKKGKAGRREVEAMFQKVASDAKIDKSIGELRGKLELLQKTGWERTEAWRGKADSFRAEALERMLDIQGKAVSFLGVATREQVAELQHELERLAKKIDNGQKARPSKKSAPKGEGLG
jgi:Skp family chaperone for outer membrane proteins